MAVPRQEIFAVIEREGLDKGIWARIGSAFQNKDGSWNLKFDLLPTDPKMTIQMRDPHANDEVDAETL